jgi:hypothetical protein
MDSNPKSQFGIKKVQLNLNPPSAIVYMALGMEEGQKYGPFNWRHNKVSASTYIAALQRHLLAWIDGENIDPESGKPHLAHMLANIAILVDATETKNLIDDRPLPGKAAEVLEKWSRD